MTETGIIPQSTALAETSPNSISEFLSKNPMDLDADARKQMVKILREQRARWEAAEAAGLHTRAKKASSDTAASLISTKSAGELDL